MPLPSIMTRGAVRRLAGLAGPLLCLLATPGPAAAQGILEQLFGLGAPKPVVVLPQSRLPRTTPAFALPLSGRPGSGDEQQLKTAPAATYHTVCVRMCDGFYIPMSYATTRENFYQDQAKCSATCGAEARLFFHRATSGSMDDAVDMSGRAYSYLPHAFRFRKAVVEGCACRPPPWSDAELARHRSYATAADLATARRNTPAQVAAAPPLADASPATEIEPLAGFGRKQKKPAVQAAFLDRPSDDATVVVEPAAQPAVKKRTSTPSQHIAAVVPKPKSVPARPPVRYASSPLPSDHGLFGQGGFLGTGLGASSKYQ